jgi:glutaminyl-peptide cyclotransferase
MNRSLVWCCLVIMMTACSPHPARPYTPKVDPRRAFEDARRQVELGPRPPGSVASERARQLIAESLREAGLGVTIDSFTALTPNGDLQFANVIGERRGSSPDLILIACHYDTKLEHDFRFVGANDGASGVAAVLEMARAVASSRNLHATYRFVFFDGEEALCRRWSECLNGSDHLYGSRHEVARMKARGELTLTRAMILFDMVGARDHVLRRDLASTGWLNDAIWRAARRLNYGEFSEETQTITGDDHTPFLEAGIPSVDLIDLRYPYWHTAGDTLDKLSPENLARVCEVVLAALPEIEKTAGIGARGRW